LQELAAGAATGDETDAGFDATFEKGRWVDDHVSKLLVDTPTPALVQRPTRIPVAWRSR
jgi:hypothetical protein